MPEVATTDASIPSGGALSTDLTNKRPKKRYVVLVSFLIAAAVFLLLHERILPFALHWLDVGETPRDADAVFVLLGDNHVRPFVAAALYNTGFANEVLLAKFQPAGVSRQDQPTHEVYRRVLLHRGVPDEDIQLLGNPVKNTMTESQVLLSYMKTHPDATVTVVTNHFHTRRTRWSLRRNLGEHAKRLRYVSAPFDDFKADDWWLYKSGWDYVVLEYIKLFAYQFVFGDALWYLAGLIVAAIVWFGFRQSRRQNSPEVIAT